MDQAAQKRASRLKKRNAMGEAAYKAQETAARNARKIRAAARAQPLPLPAPVPVITPAPVLITPAPVITPPERPPRRSTKEIMAIMNNLNKPEIPSNKAPPIPERPAKEKTNINTTIEYVIDKIRSLINIIDDRMKNRPDNESDQPYEDQIDILRETLKSIYKIKIKPIEEPTSPPSPTMKVIRTIKKTPATQIANIEENQPIRKNRQHNWPTWKLNEETKEFELKTNIKKDVKEQIPVFGEPPERPPRRSTEEIMAIMNNLNKPATQKANIEDLQIPGFGEPPVPVLTGPISRNHPSSAWCKPPWEDNKPMWVEPVNINIKKDVKETTLKNYMYKINAFHKKHYTGDPKNFISWVYDTSLIENIDKTYDTPEQKRSLMTAILSVLSRDPEMSTHTELLDWYRTTQNIYQQHINEKKN